jgi:3-oxoacyl-[acyl-carrier-protein] synthase III
VAPACCSATVPERPCLTADEEPGILSTHIHANGGYSDLLKVDVGVSRGFAPRSVVAWPYRMRGNEVFKVAVNTLGRIVDETLAANQLDKEDLDWLIPHQANLRIIQATARKLRMSMDQVVVTVDQHGNTSAASVPMALDVAFAAAASSAATSCCSRPLAAALPGVRPWSPTSWPVHYT